MSPTSSTRWNELPTEILQRIFEYARSSPRNSILTLKESVIVCKDWVKPAQQVLYEDVYLNGDNAQDFIYTICKRNSSLTGHVKKATFCEGFEKHCNIALLLDMLAYFCPNLFEMYGVNPSVKQLVWSYLNGNTSVPIRLQSFNQQNQSNEALGPLYVDVALKYIKTMTQLQISVNKSGCTLRNQHEQLVLVSKLPLFKSLRRLRVTSFEENHLFDLNLLIDSCGENVNSLYFDSLCLFQPYTPVYIIKQNNIVKSLIIDYADVPQTVFDIYPSSFDPWTIYKSLPMPNIQQLKRKCNGGVNLRVYVYPSQRAVYVLQRSTSAKVKKLTVSTLDASSPASIHSNCTTSLIKNDTTLELSLNHFHVDNFRLEFISAPLFLYAPNIIKIISENMDAFYDRYSVRIPQFAVLPTTQTMSRYFTPEAVTYKIRRYLAREYNDRNWCSFYAATHLIDISRVSSTLHFDRMIFCDASPTTYLVQRQELKLTQAYLTNSIIYYKTFYDLSERLPIIDHLTIDTCSILMEEQYSIRICLPFTTLKSLRYKVARFLNATSFASVPNETSNFENDDLLNVVETQDGMIFKIETASSIYTIRKKGDLHIPVGGIYQHLLSGTQNLFLVWIKCLDLDELILDSNGKSSIVWEKRT